MYYGYSEKVCYWSAETVKNIINSKENSSVFGSTTVQDRDVGWSRSDLFYLKLK
jgi:hypothetical protein